MKTGMLIDITLATFVFAGAVLLVQPILPMEVVPENRVLTLEGPDEIAIGVGEFEEITLTIKHNFPQVISENVENQITVRLEDNSAVSRSPEYSISSGIFDSLTYDMTYITRKEVKTIIAVMEEHDPEIYPTPKLTFVASTDNLTATHEVTVNVIPKAVAFEFTVYQALGLVLMLPSIGALLGRRLKWS